MNNKQLIFYFTFLLVVFHIADLTAQACGKITYGQKEGVSQPYYQTFLDSKGGLWVGSRGGGVNYFDGKFWQNFTTQDGLLFNWSKVTFEDREGGIWILHTTNKGATRYINGEFHQYIFLDSEQDTLLEGQKIFPVIFEGEPQLFIDNETQEVKTYGMDSTQQTTLYTFDFENQSFNLTGEPFFKQETLNKNFSLLKNNKLKGLIYWKKEMYIWIYRIDKGETIFISKNGAIDNLNFDQIFTYVTRLISENQSDYLLYKKSEGKCLGYKNGNWEVINPPQLTRYGTGLDDINLKIHSFHSGQSHFSSEKMFYTVWEINHPEFQDHFVLAEHDPYSHKIIQTTLFNEIPSQLNGGINFIKDRAGTYWYTNRQEVVRLFPNQLILPVNRQGLPADTWGITGGYGDQLWFSNFSSATSNIGLRSFDGLRLNLPNSKLQTFNRFNDTGLRDEEGNNYFTSATSRRPQITDFGILKFNQNGAFDLLCPGIQGFYLGWDRKDNLLFGTHNEGLWKLPRGKKGIKQTDWEKIDASKGLKLKNVVTALHDNKDHYWMGRGSQGLAVYLPDQDTIYNWVKEQNSENPGVQSMAKDHHGNLWFGTDKGLYFYKNLHKITSEFDIHDDKMELVATDYLGESLIQVCEIYDEHSLIVGNKKGFFLIDLDAWYQKPQKLLIYEHNYKNGSTIGEVNQNGIYIDHNKHIWLTGNKGVIRFDPNLLSRDSFYPIVRLDSVIVGENSYTSFDNNIRLKATERTVKINFSHAPNLMFNDNTRFRYRLTGDTGWSKLTEQTTVQYQNLSAGSYTFEVLAEKNGLQSEPKKLTFRISQVLWRNPLFWIAIFGFLSMVGLYYRKKEKQSHEQELLIERKNLQMANLNKEKEKLQVQAIVNQLNPHFINNALQWLQVRLDDNDDQEAVSVVGKLSENISTVFKNSRENKAYHSLFNEMTMAQNYLFIQKRRFKDKLQYELPDFKYLEAYKDINIPLLMIQIHVENAVEHGIRNKKEGGTVKISIETEATIMVIKIEDDGVGRKAAQKIGSKGTQNGVKMLKELETIFNKQNELALSQTFQDDIFTDEKGNKYGTRMIIQLPRIFNYEL